MIRNFHYIQLRIDDHNGFKSNLEENSYFHANYLVCDIGTSKIFELEFSKSFTMFFFA